jgi:drug/metabolite transporter (DMT)-like permease
MSYWNVPLSVVRFAAEHFARGLLSLSTGNGIASIGSIGLLYWLIRHQAATPVVSLFYLVPAVTSLMVFVLFGERLDAVAIAGMAACAAAVFLVNKR